MHRWYHWVTFFFLLSTMQAFTFIDVIFYGSWLGKSGDTFTRTLLILTISSSLALFFQSYRKGRGIGNGGRLALALTAFLLLTSLWSSDSDATVKQAIQYLVVVLGAIGVAGALEADEYMKLLGLACFWSAVASVVLFFVAPDYAFTDGTQLRGVFPHKNFLGQAMAVGVLAILHTMRVSRRWRGREYVMLFVLIGAIVASKSTTAGLIALVYCVIDGIITLSRRGGVGKLLGKGLTVVLVPAFVIALVYPDPILELIGKDPTLTGRTEIWDYVIRDISLKPMLGWGYYGFWSVDNPAAMEIGIAEQWFVPQAHNGLLEMLLNVGVAGTTFFIFLFIRNVALAMRCFRSSARALAISTMLGCTGIVMLGISETVLLGGSQPTTPLFFITGLMCEQAVRAAKRRRFRIVRRGHPGSLPYNSATGIFRDRVEYAPDPAGNNHTRLSSFSAK
jgi:exopolysaccharide production protein ExoQ